MQGSENDVEHGLPWEEEAEAVIEAELSDAIVDDIRGVVTVGSGREEKDYSTIEDLIRHLAEVYDESWYANVPFDGGEAVFESDADGAVENILDRHGIHQFFLEISEPNNSERIIASHELIATSAESKLAQLEFRNIDEEIAEYFAKHPEALRSIDPTSFEKLMAAIYRNRGFEVELTRKSKDGGFDLRLLTRSDIGSIITLVDCKRYAEKNKVGVDIVRGLYGVVEQNRATKGMIVTTSYFTKDAITLRNQLEYRLELADFDNVKQLLSEWK